MPHMLPLPQSRKVSPCLQVYHLMQHIVFQQTSLLYNRHLDQVLLSAIYGICKVAQLKQISFKQIINHYRRQPQAKSDVFRTVVLKQNDNDLQVNATAYASLHPTAPFDQVTG